MTTRVFLYGTLQKGQPNNHVLSDCSNGVAVYVGSGCLVDKYPLVVATDLNIPFLLYKRGTGKNVHGDIYDVDVKMLEKLDELEVCPQIYKRLKLPVRLSKAEGQSEETECEVYLLREYRQSLLDLPFQEHYSEKAGKKYIYVSDIPKEESIKLAKELLF